VRQKAWFINLEFSSASALMRVTPKKADLLLSGELAG
jgi:hypothetical protein